MISSPSDPQNPDHQATDPGRHGRIVEDVFILLCVLSLWPVILGWRHLAYEILLYVALLGLVFILVRRVRRFAQARRDADEAGSGS